MEMDGRLPMLTTFLQSPLGPVLHLKTLNRVSVRACGVEMVLNDAERAQVLDYLAQLKEMADRRGVVLGSE